MSSPIIEIDGSILEGGGQMVRVGSSLSCIFNKATIITNIRANRKPKNGLGNQHTAGLLLVSKISGLSIRGCSVGSSTVEFMESAITSPVSIESSTTVGDCGTAGAISLMIQVSYLVACYSMKSPVLTISLKGGTNVIASPPVDHTKYVLIPLLDRMGITMHIDIKRRGYYPTGGGGVDVNINRVEKPLAPLSLVEQGRVLRIGGIICGNNCDPDALRSIKRDIRKSLKRTFESIIENVEDVIEDITVDETGSTHQHERSGKRDRDRGKRKASSTLSIQLYAITSTGCVLSANDLADLDSFDGDVVVADLHSLLVSGAAIDEHTADQVLLPLALAAGVSQLLVAPPSRISTLHIDSVIHVISLFLGIDIFTIETQANGCRLITINGIGYIPT